MPFDFTKLMMNPQFQLGMGMLAGSGPGTTLADTAQGGLLGLQSYQQAQAYQAKMDALRREQEREEQNRAWMAREGMGGMPEWAAKAKYASRFPAPEKPTDDMREYQEAVRQGYTGTFMEYLRDVKGASAPQVNVGPTTVKLPQERTEESKTVGKYYGEQYVNLQKAALEANQQNAKLDRLDSLFSQTYTGTGGKALQAAKRAAQLVGIDLGGVGEAEAASALGNEMALQLRNPSGGAGMPGAMSDKDREFLVSMVPSLATTQDGRKLMIETRRRLNKRSIEVARMARAYRAKNGALDERFFDELQAFSNENPLFDDLAAPTVTPSQGGVVRWEDL